MQGNLGLYAVGILSALGATLLFGITNVVYKKIDDEIGVLNIVVSRVWVSLPLAYFFTIFSIGTVNITVPPESMIPLAVSMIFGIVIGDTMYFLSQQRIGVARAFPIVMSYPLVVYLMAALWLGEAVILQRIMGAVLVVIGVILISRAEYSEESMNKSQWSASDRRIGFILAFLTIAFWSASDVIFQFGLIAAGVAEANFFRMVVAAIIFLPIFIVSLRGPRNLPSKKLSAVAAVTGVVGFGLSLILYSYAVKFVGATITSVIIASAPVVTAPLSAVYLNEDVNRSVALGTLLTILGILLVVVILQAA